MRWNLQTVSSAAIPQEAAKFNAVFPRFDTDLEHRAAGSLEHDLGYSLRIISLAVVLVVNF